MRRKHLLLAAGIALTLAVVPAQVAQSWWAPGYGPWHGGYMHQPTWRWAPPAMRPYLRDAWRYGPAWAAWREQRRHPWRW